LKKKGAEILEAEYKTELSSYKFPDPNVIKDREFQIAKDWGVLESSIQAKRLVLDEDLKRELYKEEQRLKFANVARDFNRSANEVIRDCKEQNFGFTLQEVTAFKSTLDKEEKDARALSASKQEEYNKIHKELQRLNVTENVYTKHTPESLNQLAAELDQNLKERAEAYKKELSRHQTNDQLCKDFAQKAEALDKHVKSTKDCINKSSAVLEKQLEEVVAALESAKKDSSLSDVKGVQVKIDDAKVTNNPHTVLTVPDLEVAGRQLELFLNTKQGVLEKDIEYKNLRGITKEQHAEIDRQFTQFDKDKSGKLDAAEFKTCLYSLGEEMGKKQIQTIMDQFAGQQNATHISKAQFRDFMIQHVGVNDTRELILEAFKDIAQGDEKSVGVLNFVPRRMEVFGDEDLAFFKSSAPKTEGRGESWQYPQFVEEVFSR